MRAGLLTLMFVSLLGASAGGQTFPAYDDRHRIAVVGDAVVNVAPDRIVITFGIDTRHPTLLPAKQQNDMIARNALAAIKKAGVRDRDIQTDRLSISQRFADNQVLLGYTVRNMFAVTLIDPAQVEEVITTALNAGVNYLLSVDFQTSELKKYREQARELAVRAAREKAEKMASALGQVVGTPIQIDEDQRYAGPAYYSSWSGSGWDTGRGASTVSQVTSQVSAGEASDTVALGKVAIRAGVRVIFELTR
jgi:uncharacterized protein YggE